MAKKFYVVWKGRKTGIFTDWASCKEQVDSFAGAKYKSFKSKQEAEAAYSGEQTNIPKPIAKKTSAKKQGIKTYTADDIAAMDMSVKIFTDGGCEPNPGKAGSGIAVYRKHVVSELWYGLFDPNGTNNTAELNALHQALIMAKSELMAGNSVGIFCDSKYSIQCVTQWAINWQKNGWTKKTGEIKNLDLIKKMFALHQQLKNEIQVLHVNGHVGVEGNELADRMSILAITEKVPEFVQFQGDLNVQALLALRAG